MLMSANVQKCVSY